MGPPLGKWAPRVFPRAPPARPARYFRKLFVVYLLFPEKQVLDIFVYFLHNSKAIT